jgi:hypothetical protein
VLCISISDVDAFPSKEARIDRPRAGAKQRKGSAKSSEQDENPRISWMREGLPQRENRHKSSRNWSP